jgi:hypothetical protein
VRTVDVEQWVQTNLGPSMLARRRQALRPDMNTVSTDWGCGGGIEQPRHG